MQNTTCPFLAKSGEYVNTNNGNNCPVLEHFDKIGSNLLRLKNGHHDADISEVLRYYYQIGSTNLYHVKSDVFNENHSNQHELDNLLDQPELNNLIDQSDNFCPMDVVPDFSEHFDKVGSNMLKIKGGHLNIDLTEVLKYYDQIVPGKIFQLNKEKCRRATE